MENHTNQMLDKALRIIAEKLDDIPGAFDLMTQSERPLDENDNEELLADLSEPQSDGVIVDTVTGRCIRDLGADENMTADQAVVWYRPEGRVLVAWSGNDTDVWSEVPWR